MKRVIGKGFLGRGDSMKEGGVVGEGMLLFGDFKLCIVIECSLRSRVRGNSFEC